MTATPSAAATTTTGSAAAAAAAAKRIPEPTPPAPLQVTRTPEIVRPLPVLHSLSSLVADSVDDYYFVSAMTAPTAIAPPASTPSAGDAAGDTVVVPGVGDVEVYGKSNGGVLVNPVKGVSGGRPWQRQQKRARVVFRDDALEAVRLFSRLDEPGKVGPALPLFVRSFGCSFVSAWLCLLLSACAVQSCHSCGGKFLATVRLRVVLCHTIPLTHTLSLTHMHMHMHMHMHATVFTRHHGGS